MKIHTDPVKTRRSGFSRDKNLSQQKSPWQLKLLLRQILLTGILGLSITSTATANPNGASVASGSATFSNPSASVLEIINSPNAIINWDEFSIGAAEITRFIQQGAGSSVLNRVIGSNPSEILGQLLSNGQVWLINPNGMVFGSDAIVDTAGFIASTLDISDSNYLSGNFEFNGDSGSIVNQGLIKTSGNGDVVFIAPNIENSGVIQTESGDLILAAGRKVRLISLDYDNISFEIQSPSDSVTNIGTLLSNGGAIAAYAGQINQSGTIQANKISQSADGTIMLVANDNNVSGSISAKGTNGQSGGTIHILGDEITLTGANIDATGDSGGGEVLVGGDYQGQGPIPTAQNTFVDQGTSINASALSSGDGGKIIIWSDNQTDSFGLLVARGGAVIGDGGFIETSGKGTLNFGQPADVSAANGNAGTWLLDPEDITIGSGEAASISTALNSGSNVSIKTSDSGSGKGDINVNGHIAKTEGDDAKLTLQAHNTININGSITSTSNKLDVKLVAGAKVNINGTIDSNGGSVSTRITGIPDEPEEFDEEFEETQEEVAEESSIQDDQTEESSSASQPASEQVAEEQTPVEDLDEEELTEVLTDVVEEQTENSDTQVSTNGEAINALIEDTPLETEIDQATETLSTEITVAGEIITQGGDIEIDSGELGDTYVSGILDSSNLVEGEVGGNIHVLGNQVALLEDASLDASGDMGGGEILIGGDYQGNNIEIRNATNSYVGRNVTVTSDAITNGDGGKVIVWADNNTRYHGSISAIGGTLGGDGGNAEVSGKQNLAFDGAVDLSAVNGTIGTLLLDPFDLNIVNAGTGVDDAQVTADNTVLAADPGAFFAIGSDAVVTSLGSLTTDTILEASNNITVDDSVTSLTGRSLTLTAGNNVFINDNLNLGTGNITISAGTGSVTFNSVTAVSLTGATIDISSTSGNIDLGTAASSINADTLIMDASGDIIAGNATLTVTNNASFDAGGNVTATNTANQFGTVTFENTTSGDTLQITEADGIDLEGAMTWNNGTVILRALGGDITDGGTGALIASGTTVFDASGSILFDNATSHDLALVAANSTGDIIIDDETGSLVTTTSSGITGVTSTTGSVTLTAPTVIVGGTGQVSSAGTNSLIQATAGFLDVNAAINSSSTTFTLQNDAASAITIAAPITTTSGGDLDILSGGLVSISAGPNDLTVAGDLEIIATGSIATTNAPVVVTGNARFETSGNNQITNGGNQFGTLTFFVNGAGQSNIAESGDTELAGINQAGIFSSLETSGTLTDGAAATIVNTPEIGFTAASVVFDNAGHNFEKIEILSTSAGDITVRDDVGNLSIENITTLPTINGITNTSGNGNISLATPGLLNITENVFTVSGDISLTSATINLDDAVASTSGGTITLLPATAATTIGIGTGSTGTFVVDTDSLNNLSTIGNVIVGDATMGNVDLQPIVSTVIAGNYDLEVNGNVISINGFGLSTGALTLNAVGAVTDGNATFATDITAGGGLTITAGGNIGTSANQLVTQTTALSADTAGAGEIGISNTSATDITVSSLNAGSGGIAFDQAGGGSVISTGTISSTNGGIQISVTTGGLTVPSVTAGGTGDINLMTDGGDIATGLIDAAGNQVTLISSNAITDTNLAVNNITAANLLLTSDTGIDLDTTVTAVTADNSGVGNIDINETDGLILGIGGVGISNFNGDISITMGRAFCSCREHYDRC